MAWWFKQLAPYQESVSLRFELSAGGGLQSTEMKRGYLDMGTGKLQVAKCSARHEI